MKTKRENRQAVESDAGGTLKVFTEIDQDGSGKISFDEFSTFLMKWGSEHGQADMSAIQQACKQNFDDVDTSKDELSLEEFSTFMEGGIINLLKAAGMWNAMALASTSDVTAIQQCFDRFDVSGDGSMDTTELMSAFHDLNLHPSIEEIDGLLHVFDDDHSGALDKDEFTRLMVEYIQNKEAKCEFAEKNWCPINLFALDFDFIPWGKQRTFITGEEIVTRGHAGFGGYAETSSTSYNSIELSKTRWLHVEGNPAPMWKMNLYLGEALLVYSFLYAHEWFTTAKIHSAIPEHKNEFARGVAITWGVLRIVTFILRKRGVATTYCWGKPSSGRGQSAKCQFPVPIFDMEELCQSFLEIKGVDKKAATQVDTFGPSYQAMVSSLYTSKVCEGCTRHISVIVTSNLRR